jgi:RimJ/RimL family protein N-acetyltransferase
METARLVLRPLVWNDEEALAQVYCDAETMLWYPAPYTRKELRERIEQQMTDYPSGAGLLGMVEKHTGQLIGDCGVRWQEVEAAMEPEVGYHVHRERWGQGFATEAAKAMIGYAFHALGADFVISLIRPENVQSRRVAEKNGLALDRVVFWHDFDHCVYKLCKK